MHDAEGASAKGTLTWYVNGQGAVREPGRLQAQGPGQDRISSAFETGGPPTLEALSKPPPDLRPTSRTCNRPGRRRPAAPRLRRHRLRTTVPVRAVVLVGRRGHPPPPADATRRRSRSCRSPTSRSSSASSTWLDRHGVDEVVLSLGYLPDAFVAHFPDDRFGDLTLRYAVEAEPLGTAGGIRFAAERRDRRALRRVQRRRAHDARPHGAACDSTTSAAREATIHLCRVDDPSAFGVVPTTTTAR